MHAYSNLIWTDGEGDLVDSPDPDRNYRLLELIPASMEEVENSYAFYGSYLFHGGDTFTLEKYSRFYPNYPLSNKYKTISFRFTVESFDNKTKEAMITIEKTD